MNDVGWTTADDRVVLVLTAGGVTLGAALLQTDDFLEAEVPATRTLAKIAADGAEIAYLRCRDRVRGFSETGKTLADACVLFKLIQGHERADRESTGVQGDVVETANVFEI